MYLDRKNLKVTRWLQNDLAGCRCVLDLGCGQSSLLQYVEGIKWSIGVECWPDYIKESKAAHIHSEYRCDDILNINYPKGAYDAVMLIDVLEHIKKNDAYKLLERMERWASKKVIISVPNGFMPQGDVYGDGNEKQHHVSAWEASDLRQLGYRVRGYGGWKPLRGEKANIIPTATKAEHYLLSGLSMLSDPVVRAFPKYAFHLYAVLDVKK
jgi:hypothetical protein